MHIGIECIDDRQSGFQVTPRCSKIGPKGSQGVRSGSQVIPRFPKDLPKSSQSVPKDSKRLAKGMPKRPQARQKMHVFRKLLFVHRRSVLEPSRLGFDDS